MQRDGYRRCETDSLIGGAASCTLPVRIRKIPSSLAGISPKGQGFCGFPPEQPRIFPAGREFQGLTVLAVHAEQADFRIGNPDPAQDPFAGHFNNRTNSPTQTPGNRSNTRNFPQQIHATRKARRACVVCSSDKPSETCLPARPPIELFLPDDAPPSASPRQLMMREPICSPCISQLFRRPASGGSALQPLPPDPRYAPRPSEEKSGRNADRCSKSSSRHWLY